MCNNSCTPARAACLSKKTTGFVFKILAQFLKLFVHFLKLFAHFEVVCASFLFERTQTTQQNPPLMATQNMAENFLRSSAGQHWSRFGPQLYSNGLRQGNAKWILAQNTGEGPVLIEEFLGRCGSRFVCQWVLEDEDWILVPFLGQRKFENNSIPKSHQMWVDRLWK
tara:strand:+ start:331 stop:831 length:501 start_codon:yes stop_codon:yes gene_type:complete